MLASYELDIKMLGSGLMAKLGVYSRPTHKVPVALHSQWMSDDKYALFVSSFRTSIHDGFVYIFAGILKGGMRKQDFASDEQRMRRRE